MKPLYKLVEDFLKENANKKFTSKEIALEIYKQNKENYSKKRGKFDSDDLFLKQLAAEISRDKNKLLLNGIIIEEDNIPYLFYFSKETESKTQDNNKQQNNAQKIEENKLYPLLGDYLNSNFNILSKRIDEKKSKNNKGKNGNKWLHPDVVGIKILDNNWDNSLKECYKDAGNNRIEIFSYEVKIEITPSSLRESFFQAVSNSSWANYGYLVTTEIKGNILQEIEMLSKLHGIGLIKLNIDNPPESQILFPARYKENIDWTTANRLTIENKDFSKFIQAIQVYYSTGIINENDWFNEKDWKTA